MTTISAKSILASRHALDPSKRVDTLLLRYPRPIHAEMQTHRIVSLDEDYEISLATPSLMADGNLSRNASSSRAIPIEKLIQDVLDDPYIPLHWGKNQKGMQADEECNARIHFQDEPMSWSREEAWLVARDNAVHVARGFAKAGYHKQLVNRLLEPFGHITVVVTATNWSNFLALRDHPDAEPHIQILAQEVRKALDGATVEILQPGEWHLPFVSKNPPSAPGLRDIMSIERQQKLSVACCASTSYKTVDGFDMILERASALYDRLSVMRPAHASPFEHQAQAATFQEGAEGPYGEWRVGGWNNQHLGGNLGPGWIQLRKTLVNECL